MPKRLNAEQRQEECTQRAATVVVGMQARGDYLQARGYTPREKGVPGVRRLPRKRRRETDDGRSSLLEKEVFAHVGRARSMFPALPSHLPARGACFGLAFVVVSLLTICFNERSDLLRFI